MPLNRVRTDVTERPWPLGSRSARAQGAGAGRLARILLLALALAVPATAWAHQKDEGDQDNLLHDLARVAMCVDADSVALHLDGFTPARRGGAAKMLVPGVAQALGGVTHTLAAASVKQSTSCVGSPTYLAVDIRITTLDPNVYRRYGRHPYSYAIWVQVGQYATPEQRSSDDPSLQALRFEAFDENVFDENGPRRAVEDAVLGQSLQLLVNLGAAYQMDNP
jgi:hypothetical protein